MDDKWFKQQQKKVGVTAEDIAKKMGRDRSVVSHIYTGRQKMSLEWAETFAEVLQAPIDEVLKRAGALKQEKAQRLNPEFSGGDAEPWTGNAAQMNRMTNILEALSLNRDGISTWTVTTNAMRLDGILIGDIVIVDAMQSELAKAGDIVLAQIYDWGSSNFTNAIRRFEPPALVPSDPDTGNQRIHIVDGKNVVIKGKIASIWRHS